MFSKSKNVNLDEIKRIFVLVDEFDYPFLSETDIGQQNSAHKLATMGLTRKAFFVQEEFNNNVKDKIDLSITDENGATPLHIAAFRCADKVTNQTTFPLLLAEATKQKNFDFTSTDNCGRTILHLLAHGEYSNFYGEKTSITKFLDVIKNISLETQDKYGATPLHTAIFSKNFDIAKDLIEHGASLENRGGL